MRLWSLHPSYLDAKGLVALWREALLALHVLSGKTRGYRNHPQLCRFKNVPDPLAAICAYLSAVALEADVRGYHFDRSKIPAYIQPGLLPLSRGQSIFERDHLLRKLQLRSPERVGALEATGKTLRLHPLFRLVPGPVEAWEKDGALITKKGGGT